jgi:hypothetical protein
MGTSGRDKRVQAVASDPVLPCGLPWDPAPASAPESSGRA